MAGWREFETTEEAEKRYMRVSMTIVIIISILTVTGIGWTLYETYKPVPNIPECKEKGYEGGAMDGHKVYCFDDCVDNILTHCKTVRPIR